MQSAALADQHLQAGNLEAARQSIREALGKRDDIPELHLLSGRIEFMAESYGTAFAAYANALALDNRNMEALQAVSQLGLRTGNLRQSLDATERILTLQPNQEDALVARGVHSIIQRRYDEAIEYADRVLAQRPDSEQAIILQSRAIFMTGDSAKALEVIKSVEAEGAGSEGVARTLLELYREMRDPEGMQAQFDRLGQLRPDNAEFRIDEADLRFKLGRDGAGREILVKLLARTDLGPEAASRAVELLRNHSAALSQADVQRIAGSGSDAARLELVRYLIEGKRADLARLAIRELPAAAARPLEARLAVLEKDPAKALQIAGEVLRKDETQCDALAAAAEASLLQGRTLDALRNAQRAAAECPGRSEAWLAAAAAYAAREQAASVQRVYRDAINANPQNFLLTEAYGDWLFAEGRQREAIALARTFTRKSPALKKGWEYYVSLCARSNAACVDEAGRGLADARTRFGVDPEIGKLPPGGLFGRLARR